jgi:hypothetical protein
MKLKRTFADSILVFTVMLLIFNSLPCSTRAIIHLPLHDADTRLSYATVNETFELQFKIHDIVRMKSLHFTVNWDSKQLSTDAHNVLLKDFLPPPYESVSITFGEVDTNDYAVMDVQIPCEKPSINGTGELFSIRFKVLNPWDDGNPNTVDIPPYHWAWADMQHTHKEWYPDTCWNYINMAGYIDKLELDGSIFDQHLGTDINVIGPDINPLNPPTYDFDNDSTTTTVANQPCGTLVGGYIKGYYEFRPVPGDLNLDGHADVIDLTAIAKYYGRFLGDGKTPAWAGTKGFDLDGNNIIDIFDMIIVSKNICRLEPDKIHPFPLPDP